MVHVRQDADVIIGSSASFISWNEWNFVFHGR